MRCVALAGTLALAWLAGCAATPPAPRPGRATAWGYVRLVPREGVTPGSGGAYGDRRLREVRFVNYSHPGFAVVYLVGETHAGGRAHVEIRRDAAGAVLEPAHAALARGGVLEVVNATDESHVLSSPRLGVVRALAPGERTEFELGDAGEQELFLLDRKDAAATVFIAPGPFSVVSEAGRFQLDDLEPGRRELRVWHPRFPPAAREVELLPGESTRVDVEVGVDRMKPEEDLP